MWSCRRTSTIRAHATEIQVERGPETGLDAESAAQCQHVRSVSPARIDTARGNVGATTLTQIRAVLALILDLPS
ncbi:MAG: type II toxin-antitoxin system PemK/MazF family toxin [Actinomycetota bacterium]